MMRGEDFLELAVSLLDSDSEAAWRSAVSRAYYGAFHTAKELLADAGIALPDSGEAHRKILYCLKESGDEGGTDAGNRLGKLRDERNAADYSLRDRRFREKLAVERQVSLARTLVTMLRGLRAEPVWSRFKGNVRTYAARVLRLPVK